MKQVVIVFFFILLIASRADAGTTTLTPAQEVHQALLEQERENMPKQIANMLILMRPDYRKHKDIITQGMVEIFESEEFERIRTAYLSKSFTDDELEAMVRMVKSREFRLFQEKMPGIIRESQKDLVKLADEKAKELEVRIKNAEQN